MAKLSFLMFVILFSLKASQLPEGIYHSQIQKQDLYFKLTTEKNLAMLEVFSGKKDLFLVKGEVFQDSIYFPKVKINNKDFNLVISQYQPQNIVLKEGKQSDVIIIKKLTSNTDLKLPNIPKYLKNGLDPDLIGDWILLYSKNPEGKIENDEFTGKGYLIKYSESGTMILDPRAFRDNHSRMGLKNFSYSDIPNGIWRTSDNKLIIDWRSVGDAGGETESNYLIRNDTLYKISTQGHITVHLRKY